MKKVIAVVIFIIIVALLYSALRKIFFRLLKYAYKTQNKSLLSTLYICSAVIPGTFEKFTDSITKERDSLYSEVASCPTEENADRLIEYVNSHILVDKPECWNMLRGVWYAINESSDITSETKRKVRTVLTTKGLMLAGKDKDIVDNYGG